MSANCRIHSSIIAATCLMLIGCSSELYPGRTELLEFVADSEARLAVLADQIEAEQDIEAIWCIPPAKVLADVRDEPEPVTLSGLALETYSELCIDLQPDGVDGAEVDESGTALVMMPVVDDGLAYRVDLVRPAAGGQRRPDCTWWIAMRSAASCEVGTESDWVLRYTWNEQNDLQSLFAR